MTVRKNLEIGLKLRGVPKLERETKVRDTARILGIEEYLERRPARLSGGQRQRVAMGRAIVRDPEVFLLDEPLSNLDAKLRAEVRAEIKLLQARLNTTTIFVTHDQVEAMTMAHRIAILRHGRLQQVGTPSELYTTPSNLFVAGFIGSPAMNFLQGQLESDPAGMTGLRYTPGQPTWRLAVPPRQNGSLSGLIGQQAVVGVRPEDMSIAPGPPRDPSWLAGKVALVELLGSDTLVYVDVDAPPVVTEQVAEALTAEGGVTIPAVTQRQSARFCVRVPALVDFAPRAVVQLAPIKGLLHFFRPMNGELVASVQHGSAPQEQAHSGYPPQPMAGGIRQ
jgi:multiple sugar transport system ATP-binding protein